MVLGIADRVVPRMGETCDFFLNQQDTANVMGRALS